MIQIEVKINGVNTLVDVSKLEKTEDGLFAEFYKEDGTIYTVEVQKEQARIELEIEIQEAKDYLDRTEHKFNTDYELNDDETPEIIDAIKVKRSECRAFIRENKGEING